MVKVAGVILVRIFISGASRNEVAFDVQAAEQIFQNRWFGHANPCSSSWLASQRKVLGCVYQEYVLDLSRSKEM